MIGEFPETGKTIPARAGVWLVYFREEAELVGVHAECLARIEDLRTAAVRLPRRLSIHGARMAIADGDAAKDEDFCNALGENNEAELRGRAAQVFLGGDGHGTASVARENDRAVLVLVGLG